MRIVTELRRHSRLGGGARGPGRRARPAANPLSGMHKAVLDQQYTELAELAGAFIHDVKNHLGTLKLNLQLLAEDFTEPQTQRERRALERIQRLEGECEHLVEVANDFLRFARLRDLELTPTDLAGAVEEITDFFLPSARTAGIEIKSYLPADLPAVGLNRDMFKQAILNLLINAQQAMPQGGEITLQASADDGSVSLSLIDTGQGMTPEVVAKAFRPFFSTRPGGTGLGLATTRKIIQAHGGTIDVQSEAGRGTKFTIRLPRATNQPAAEGPLNPS